VYTFIAKGLKKVSATNLDAGEKIILKPVSFEELLEIGTNQNFVEKEILSKLYEAKLCPEKKERLKKLFNPHCKIKTILVDAVDSFVIETPYGFEIFQPMRKMLDEFPNAKIILTGANDEQFSKFGLDKMPYKVFSLKHNPEKTNPEHFNLRPEEVIYFEHNPEAVKSAQSVGIKTYFWDNKKRPLDELRIFLERNT
jgi:hypothetical protein